jgi:hypothetical protein
MERIPTLQPPTADQIRQKRNLGAQVRKRNFRNLRFLFADQRQEVSFERVIYWLKTQSVSIIKSTSDVYYVVDGQPKTKQQILYQANLLREQLHLPIFWVKGVTYT